MFDLRSGVPQDYLVCAAAALIPFTLGLNAANAAIVTNTYTTIHSAGLTPNIDGAVYPSGTVATVSVKFDDSVTYMGGPDTVVRTLVSIPGGLRLTIGADVFTADTYNIDYYNAGPGRGSADVVFHTGFFPSSLLPVLHNGLPFSGPFTGQMQFAFYGVSDFLAKPVVPGLSFPIPPYVGEGFIRDANRAGEFMFPQETWAEVPAPGAAVMFGLGGLAVARRRRG